MAKLSKSSRLSLVDIEKKSVPGGSRPCWCDLAVYVGTPPAPGSTLSPCSHKRQTPLVCRHTAHSAQLPCDLSAHGDTPHSQCATPVESHLVTHSPPCNALCSHLFFSASFPFHTELKMDYFSVACYICTQKKML